MIIYWLFMWCVFFFMFFLISNGLFLDKWRFGCIKWVFGCVYMKLIEFLLNGIIDYKYDWFI